MSFYNTEKFERFENAKLIADVLVVRIMNSLTGIKCKEFKCNLSYLELNTFVEVQIDGNETDFFFINELVENTRIPKEDIALVGRCLYTNFNRLANCHAEINKECNLITVTIYNQH